MQQREKMGQAARSDVLARMHAWLSRSMAGITLSLPPQPCGQVLPQQRGSAMLRGSVLALIAAGLSYAPLLFGAQPLGLGFLCAAEGQLAWVTLGYLVGIWGASASPWLAGNGYLYAVAAMVALLLRLLARVAWEPPSARISISTYRHAARVALDRLLHIGQSPTQAPAEDTAAEDKGCSCSPQGSVLSLRWRVMAAVISALIPAIGVSVRGGFAFYDCCGAVSLLFGAPLASCVFAGAWRREESNGSLAARVIGLSAVLVATLYCTRSMSILGLYPALVVFASLLPVVQDRAGLLGALAVALLGSFAIDVQILPCMIVYVAVYALVNLAFGGLALPASVVASALSALLFGGSVFAWEVAPSVLVGALLLAAGRRLQTAAKRAQKRQEKQQFRVDETAQRLLCVQLQNEALCERLAAMSSAFASLGEVFCAMDESMERPDAGEIRGMLDEIFDKHCPACPYRSRCWSEEYSATAEGVRSLSRALANRPDGAVADLLPEAMRRRCPQLIDMLEELNFRIGRRAFERGNAREGEAYARSFDGIGQLMRDVLREGGDVTEASCNAAQSEAVALCLDRLGMRVKQVCVTGRRRLTVCITGITPAALTVPREQLQTALGEVCGARFGKPRYSGGEEDTLTLRSLPAYRIDYAHMGSPALCEQENEERRGAKGRSSRILCGDTVRVFESEDGMFYALLCDGMGSGRLAALTSGTAAVFLERVLRAGVSVHTALRMLNQYLRARSDEHESSTTVDLLALDLYTGEARLIKCGAAPTLQRRGTRVSRLTSHTLPLGILQALDASVLPFEVKDGDCIVLVSDGVSDTAADAGTGGGTNWLDELLAATADTDLSAWVEAVIAKAREHGSHDDVSVIALRIERETHEKGAQGKP